MCIEKPDVYRPGAFRGRRSGQRRVSSKRNQQHQLREGGFTNCTPHPSPSSHSLSGGFKRVNCLSCYLVYTKKRRSMQCFGRQSHEMGIMIKCNKSKNPRPPPMTEMDRTQRPKVQIIQTRLRPGRRVIPGSNVWKGGGSRSTERQAAARSIPGSLRKCIAGVATIGGCIRQLPATDTGRYELKIYLYAEFVLFCRRLGFEGVLRSRRWRGGGLGSNCL